MTAAEILLDLAAIPSVSSMSNRKVVDYARSRLDPARWTFEEYEHAEGKVNLVARTRGAAGAAGLALVCHTDTVPYEASWAEAVRPVERGGRIYGRGTADVKGFLACILAAVEQVDLAALAESLVIALTADEEIGCIGAKYLAKQRAFDARRTIIGEPTSLRAILAGKGYGLGRIVVRGKEAHSAFPAQGRSAIYDAARVIAAVERIAAELMSYGNPDFEPPYTTVNIGLIEGGTAKNIVAGECRLTIEWRPVPGQDAELPPALLRRELAALREVGVSAELTVLRSDPPFEPSAADDVAALMERLTGHAPATVSFGSEAAHLRPLTDEVIVFGPGSMSTAHQTGEYVPVGELERCVECLRAAITRYCATPSEARP
jgi:acetylornithine deacetylase